MNTPKLSDKIGQFVSIPNTVVTILPIIRADAMSLFVYLRYRTNGKSGNAFPSYATIQKDTGFNRRKIAKAIRSLIKAGLVIRRRRFGQSTIYTLTLPAKPISTKNAPNEAIDISSDSAPIISSDSAPIISNTGDPLTRLNELDRSKKTERISGKPPHASKQKPDELKIESVYLGAEIIAQLKIANSALGRKSPAYFANPQQRDQFDAALKTLNGQGKALIVKGIAQRGTGLSALGAWLEACAKNQNKNGVTHGSNQGHSTAGDKPSRQLIESGARINAQRNGTTYEAELARLEADYT